jgi:hypothetical protein
MRNYFRQSKILSVYLIIIILFFILLCSIFFTAYTDRYWVCEYTGSEKNARHWFCGFINESFHASRLESFIKTKSPNELKHNWKWISSTKCSIYGKALEFADANAYTYMLKSVIETNQYEELSDRSKEKMYKIFTCSNSLSVEGKKQLYDLLLSAINENQLTIKIDNIYEELNHNNKISK